MEELLLNCATATTELQHMPVANMAAGSLVFLLVSCIL